jgi:succinate-semialdehyde dehydrogenase/glutarate-semialdehyde dehydrogenase
MESINPATGELLKTFQTLGDSAINSALAESVRAATVWPNTPFGERARLLRAAAQGLRARLDRYADLMVQEMGKPVREARAEIEKCAWGCEYFADHGEQWLGDAAVKTAAARSYVACLPLGTVLAIMPWNFPFWQVFRFAAPALMAGNTALIKHSSNTPQCALAVQEIFDRAGFPPGVARVLLISGTQAERLIANPRVHAVTLTGSEAAGRRVAAAAGAALKKSVLELGGSDAFVVLEDADLEHAASQAVAGRFQNSGQSCIAAKRFILVDSIADRFVTLFEERVRSLKVGDPLDDATQVGPLARADLRDELHRQVLDSVRAGAVCVTGGEPLSGPGNFYAPTILDRVLPGMPAYEQELFGPVAAVIRARDEVDALRIANDNRYGLGGSVWTRDSARGERFARALQTGMGFVNGMVHSDPRLPFGGIKASGYGRELGASGIREFVNVKTVWVK